MKVTKGIPSAAVTRLAHAPADPLARHPISAVEWVPASALQANDYNPNVQPPPERRLLKVSLLEDGWTQPIVVFDDGTRPLVIVDGENRWQIASTDPEVAAMTDGLVPIVRIARELSHRMMSTIRHNRARGEHAVRPMAELVRALLEDDQAPEDVCFLLQMEAEELERLADRAGMPERVARDGSAFSKGWVPGKVPKGVKP